MKIDFKVGDFWGRYLIDAGLIRGMAGGECGSPRQGDVMGKNIPPG